MSGMFDRPRAGVAERVRAVGVVAAVSSFPIRRAVETRRVVLVAAVAMFVAVFVLRQTSSDAADVVALLAVVPIALVALESGLLVGVAAAVLALGVVGVLALDVRSGTVGLYIVSISGLISAPRSSTLICPKPRVRAWSVYRVVEETLEAVGTAREVSVRALADGKLEIEVRGAKREITADRLTILAARIELTGGTLASTASELHAIIPVAADSRGFVAAA